MQIRTPSPTSSSRKVWVFLAIIAAMLLIAWIVRQVTGVQLNAHGTVWMMDSYTLSDTVDDSLAVVADRINLAEGSTVQGDTGLFGRTSATAAGTVNGDLAMIGGDLTVSGAVNGDVALLGTHLVITGQISGDVLALGSDLTIAPDARLTGKIANCAGTLIDNRSNPTPVKSCSQLDDLASILLVGTGLGSVLPQPGIGTMLVSLLLTGLSILAVILFPRHIRTVQRSAMRRPLRAGLAGVLGVFLGVGLTAVVLLLIGFVPVVGVALLPVNLLILLLLGVLVMVGWIALAAGVGEWLFGRLQQPQPPFLAVMFGSLLLAGVWHGLALVTGLIALAAVILISVVGSGAALLTRFGTRSSR